MDDIVRQAMAKWPHVPHCYGWMGLDARGNWYMRDDQVQARGAFPASRGALLRHEKLLEFIYRNYDADEYGQWFFQNGPQRVYLELEVTPWIWRISQDHTVTSHTGLPTVVHQCIVDAEGLVYLQCELGFGLVHTLDVTHAADAIEMERWVVEEVRGELLPARYGYVKSPSVRHQKEKAGL